jgi:hypothetical protein
MITLQRTIATGILLLVATAAPADKYEQQKRNLAHRTAERLKNAQLQELNFADADVRKVIEHLLELGREVDGQPFNVLFMDSPNKPKKKPVAKARAAALGGFESGGKNMDDIFGIKPVEPVAMPLNPGQRITLHLRRVSIWDGLKYITEMAGLTFRIDGSVIVIKRKGAREDIVTKFYPVDPTLFQERVRTIRNTQ